MVDNKRDAGASQVQEKVDDQQDKGYLGVKADPTPNENYTLKGVTSGAPTPETDEEAARKAGEHHHRIGSKFGHRGEKRDDK